MNRQTDSMKLFSLIIGICGICFLVYQIYSMSENKLDTETIRSMTVSEGIETKGTFFRDEQLLTRKKGGVYDLLIDEWEKLAKNQEIAVLYADGADYERSVQLRALEQKLARFSQIRDSGKEAVSPTSMNAAIYSSIYSTAGMANTGNFNGLVAERDALLSNLLNREASFSGDTSADKLVSRLEKEYNELKNQPQGERTHVRADGAGLFSSGVDGYEKRFTPEMILSITPEEYEASIAKAPETVNEEGLIGKLIKGNRWYFSTILGAEDAKKLSINQTYGLIFNSGEGTSIDAGLTRLEMSKSGSYLAVFSSEYDLGNVARMRESECEIVLKTYSGFRVPKSALRIQDGVEGVYCLVGVQAKFKPIVRLYEAEDYFICSADLSSTKELFLYDEIIISGKNLFDGKIVK